MRQAKSRAGCRVTWVLVGMAAAVALPAFAGIRGPTVTVNDLKIDGRSYGGAGAWAVSSPTLKAPSGYLSFDASGKSQQVTFRKEKGPGITWFFTEKSRFEDHEAKGKDAFHYVSEEQRGYTMKLRAGEGPLEGWYLGVEEGKLVLVKDSRNAATLRMVEKTVQIKSK